MTDQGTREMDIAGLSLLGLSGCGGTGGDEDRENGGGGDDNGEDDNEDDGGGDGGVYRVFAGMA